jgi:hypothetical protein
MKSHLVIAAFACGLFGLTPRSVGAANGSAAADLTWSHIKARDARDRTAVTDCYMIAKAAPTRTARTGSEPPSCCRVPKRSAEAAESGGARREGSCRAAAASCAD